MDKQQEKYIEMTQKPVERLVLKLALPTIISMLITTFYSMVDSFFVGKINRKKNFYYYCTQAEYHQAC